MRLPVTDAVDLDVPPGWEDVTLVTLLGPQTTDGRPTLVVGRDVRQGAAVAAYARDQLARLRQETLGFVAHQATEEGPLRFVAEHTFSIPGRPAVRQLQVFLGHGDFVTTLSITHPPSSFAQERAAIEAIARSFRTTALAG